MSEDYLDTVYKYTDLEGAEKVLSNCTLRFSRPSAMNDPFDVYIDDLFGMDIKEFLEEANRVLFDTIKENPALIAQLCNISVNEAKLASNRLNNLSADELSTFKELMATIDLAEFDSSFGDTKDNIKKYRDDFAQLFKDYGIFCATKTPRNLLMWSHYAQQHKGTVLGFKADIEKDSFLRLMEPVTYCDERPFIIKEAKELLLQQNSIDIARQTAQRLLHTKSSEWGYEEELRLAIPGEVKEGESASYLKFYPHELTEIYLGIRMRDSNKTRVIGLAKSVNPNIRIYTCVLSKRRYGLDFERIS